MNKKLVILLLIFFIIEFFVLFQDSPSDNSVYFYSAKAVTQGYAPYEDFKLAHSFFQIYIYAGIIKLFGANLVILKLFDLLIFISIAIFLYLISKERYNKKIALIGTFLFLVSFNSLLYSTYSFGTELAVLFFLMAFYFNNKDSSISGVFFSLSVITRLHLLPLGLILFFTSKNKKRFFLSTLLIPLFYGLSSLLIPNFISNVFGYHLAKSRWHSGWLVFLRTNLHLIILFFLSLKWIKDKLFIYIISLYLVFLVFLNSVFMYYFLIVTILLSIEAALCFVYFKYKKVLYILLAILCVVMVSKLGFFVVYETSGYNSLSNYISTLDGDIMGASDVASLMALKTNKNISKLQIDTNFQRNETYNYSDSIVIHYKNLFDGKKHNCTLLNEMEVGLKIYWIWDCP